MKINQKRFDIIYFGLWAILFAFVVYTAIDILPSFAISSTITTPNDSNCQYEGPYNHITGNFSCANIPTGSNQTLPRSWSANNNQYPSSYDANTGITSFSTFPNVTGGSIINTPSSYDYIIFQNTTGYYAMNGQTNHIEFSGYDGGLVISNAAASFYPNPGNILVKCGIYNLYSQIQLWKSASLYGAGEDCTIFKRTFNATQPQMIKATPSYQGYNGYTILKDFTLDGNYGHSNATLEASIGGNGSVNNVKVINYNGIALEADNNVNIDHFTAIGVNSALSGSIEGIWSGTNSKITLTNSDIENNRLSAIFAQGNTIISNSYFNHNHCQTTPTGGGQIALVNGGTVTSNIITNGCGSLTSGIETNSGIYILSDNVIYGNQNYGIATNGQSSTIIISNNYLKGNGHTISGPGSAIILSSNNSQ